MTPREFDLWVCPTCGDYAAPADMFDGLKCNGKSPGLDKHKPAVMEKIRVVEMADSPATDQGGT